MFLIGAYLILLFHGLYVAFLVMGLILVPLFDLLAYVHLPIFLLGILMIWLEIDCPLTKFEKQCLRKAGRQPYKDECLDHYVFNNLPSKLMGVTTKQLIVFVVIGLNLIGYFFIYSL